MNLHVMTHAEQLRLRCQAVAGLIFLLLLAITLFLWRASIDFMDFRFQKVTEQNAGQAIERFTALFQDRLEVLTQVSHFYESIPNLTPQQFQRFCAAVMGDTPGIRAVMLTDTHGRPTWVAPQATLPTPVIYMMTADPKLDSALQESLMTGQVALTQGLDVPELGAGFLAAMAVRSGGKHVGYVIGLFHYQELFSYLIPPDMLVRYRISIAHAGRAVYPSLGMARIRPYPAKQPSTFFGQTEVVLLGGLEWLIAMEPVISQAASPTNLVSLTILGLGLSLSLLLTYLAYRWQWQAAVFQAQARDSQSRLERTGLSLAEAKTEMDLILNSVDEGIIFYDEQLEPVQANAAFLMAFNMSEDDVRMRAGHAHHEQMIQLIGSETKYWSLFNALRGNPEQSYTDELELKPKGGGKGPYRALLRRGAAACGADGAVRGILVIYKDLTKIKMIDRVKEEFLANVTHELRSPLASVKGFAETLRRDPQMAPETRAEFVKIICEEAARLQNLIDELLDLRRMEAQGVTFVPTAYDVKALVEEIVKGARSVLLSKRLAVKVQWDGLFGSTLKGDVAQISRALRNLLINAAKYSPEGGEIRVTGHCGQYRVWIEVSDQGSGIDEKDLPHIFDKFYRGSRQEHQKGTGLGLAIVKNIIEMHGGHLGVRSEVGVGATFRVDLPRAYAKLKETRQGAAAPPPAETPLEALEEFEERHAGK